MSLLKKIAHFKAHNYSTARIINLRLISSPEVATGLEVETFSRGSLRARLSAKGGEKAKGEGKKRKGAEKPNERSAPSFSLGHTIIQGGKFEIYPAMHSEVFDFK